jgi:hypothetical protein
MLISALIYQITSCLKIIEKLVKMSKKVKCAHARHQAIRVYGELLEVDQQVGMMRKLSDSVLSNIPTLQNEEYHFDADPDVIV